MSIQRFFVPFSSSALNKYCSCLDSVLFRYDESEHFIPLQFGEVPVLIMLQSQHRGGDLSSEGMQVRSSPYFSSCSASYNGAFPRENGTGGA